MKEAIDRMLLAKNEKAIKNQGFGSGSARIRMFLPCPDPGKKVRKWMNKSLFCRVGDVQCKQFHFFCSDFKHPLLRIIWNVKKTQKKSFFPFTPSPLPRIPPGSGSAWRILPGSGSAKKMRIRNPEINIWNDEYFGILPRLWHRRKISQERSDKFFSWLDMECCFSVQSRDDSSLPLPGSLAMGKVSF